MFGLPLYLRNAAPSTAIKRGSNGTEYEMRKKREERETKRRKKWGIKSQKEKKEKNLHAHKFSHRDPCAMTFRECKILAVFNCKK